VLIENKNIILMVVVLPDYFRGMGASV